jgi:hypothetical protein
VPNIKYAIFFFLLTFRAFSGLGQSFEIDTLQIMQALPIVQDSLRKLDSAGVISQLKTAIEDSLKNSTNASSEEEIVENDSTYASKGKPKGDVETTIDYNARDSIFFDLKNQMMFMYGESKVTYGNMILKAERIDMDWVNNSLEANYVEDSLGKKIGKPVFEEAGDVYETDDMKYNFKTRKAIINGIITEQDGAIMHGNRVKKNEHDEMFIRGAKYTTCDMAEPHFHINSTKLKVIPNNKILSGPFNLHFGEIPTPIGFPFGLFPEPQSKSSGIIFPSYGEDFNRGFFLRQLGYYFYLGEYIDLKVTGDIFSKGSYGVNTMTRYRVRYKYSGNLNVRYNKTVNPQFESNSFSEDLWVNWSHTPESFGTSRFSASVSGGTSTFTANNNNLGQDYNANVNAQFSSNISYSKTFKGTPFNMAVNARHSQNIATGLVTLSLPEVSLNASRIQPFKNVGNLSDNFIGKLGFSYRMSAKNTVTNGAAPSAGNLNVVNRHPLSDSLIDFNSDNLSLLLKSRGQQGVRHQIPISTSFSVLKNLTLTPSFNYTEVWYPNELRYSYDEQENGVRIDTLQGFSRAGWYSGGASVSTRLYGFYPVGGRRIQAIRHVLTPSVGMSLSPDFGDPDRGYYQEVRINEEGDTRFFSKHERFAYGGAPLGESATVSFSLGNNLEMKVLSANDSIEEYKKVKIFDNMSISSSYNMLADSFNLSNFNWNARTSLFNNKVSLALSGTVDPYVYVLDSIQEIASGNDRVHQRKLDQYTWNNGQGVGSLTRMSVAIGFNLSPKGGGSSDQRNQRDPNALPPGPGDFRYGSQADENFEAGNVNKFIATDPTQYVPFDVPWRLNVNYNLSYGKVGFEKETITQTLNFSGNVSITDKTSVNFNSGYDMKKKEFVHTQLNVNRDLHCWNISFNWVPFGAFQSYFVTIAVNSAMLKDLKLDKRTQHSAQVF